MTDDGARGALLDRLGSATLVHIDARALALHLLGGEAGGELDGVLAAVRAGEIRAQTSSMTLYQILAEVYRRGEAQLAREVAQNLQVHPRLEMVSATPDIAVQAAEVRAQLGGRPERAIQIATALTAGAEIYLTTGSGLRRIAGMTVVNVEDSGAAAVT